MRQSMTDCGTDSVLIFLRGAKCPPGMHLFATRNEPGDERHRQGTPSSAETAAAVAAASACIDYFRNHPGKPPQHRPAGGIPGRRGGYNAK